MDFFDALPEYLDSCTFPIRYELKQFQFSVGPYEAGNHWAYPDHKNAGEAMKKVAGGSCTKQYSDSLSTLVYDRFGEAAIGEEMKKLLGASLPNIKRKIDNFQS